ncbi:MAG: tRNA pseudouridine(55) synthase TruB [Flavobacteriales bacterium]|nr:tRNA pseudouridine(55) synthase TruB [Flavobacteriales bacterium]
MLPSPSDPEFVLDDLLRGSVILIDKPTGWTSFDVVNKIKWFAKHQLGLPPFKIGHAGTLDPLATGLLIVCTGKGTKLISGIQGGEKEYEATLTFGRTTKSFDLETAPEGDYPTAHLSAEYLAGVLASFVGEQWQQPPVFSAKQINGQRAYHAARNGETPDLPPAHITIHGMEMMQFADHELTFRVKCSKGTYIRSLAHDIGIRAGSGAYLKALRRTTSLPYSVETAIEPLQLLEKLKVLHAPAQSID